MSKANKDREWLDAVVYHNMSKHLETTRLVFMAVSCLIGNGRETAKRKCEIKLWRAGVLATKGNPQ